MTDMYNVLLMDRNATHAGHGTVTGTPNTAFPSRSPFNAFINERDPVNKGIGHMPISFKSSDGIFPDTSPVPGRGILWKYSTGDRANKVKDDPVNPVWLKKEMITIEDLDEMNKVQEGDQRKADVFLPAIFAKLELYKKKVAEGLNPDIDTILTSGEKEYLTNLGEKPDAVKDMLMNMHREGKLAPETLQELIPGVTLPPTGLLAPTAATPAQAAALAAGAPPPAGGVAGPAVGPAAPGAPGAAVPAAPPLASFTIPAVNPFSNPIPPGKQLSEQNIIQFIKASKGEDKKTQEGHYDTYFSQIGDEKINVKEYERVKYMVERVKLSTTDPKAQETIKIMIFVLNEKILALNKKKK